MATGPQPLIAFDSDDSSKIQQYRAGSVNQQGLDFLKRHDNDRHRNIGAAPRQSSRPRQPTSPSSDQSDAEQNQDQSGLRVVDAGCHIPHLV